MLDTIPFDLGHTPRDVRAGVETIGGEGGTRARDGVSQ